MPHRSAAADSCRPSHPHLRSLPGQPFPSGQRQPDVQPSRQKNVADCSMGGCKLQRITSPMDCRGIAAAALPSESPSSNIRLLIASFFSPYSRECFDSAQEAQAALDEQGEYVRRSRRSPRALPCPHLVTIRSPSHHLVPFCPGTCHRTRGLQVCPPLSGRAVQLSLQLPKEKRRD